MALTNGAVGENIAYSWADGDNSQPPTPIVWDTSAPIDNTVSGGSLNIAGASTPYLVFQEILDLNLDYSKDYYIALETELISTGFSRQGLGVSVPTEASLNTYYRYLSYETNGWQILKYVNHANQGGSTFSQNYTDATISKVEFSRINGVVTITINGVDQLLNGHDALAGFADFGVAFCHYSRDVKVLSLVVEHEDYTTDNTLSYSEIILNTDGLLGYYPLNTQNDISGLHNQGATIAGEGAGEVDPLTGGLSSVQTRHNDPAAGAPSYVAVPATAKAIELRAKPYQLLTGETYTLPLAARSDVYSDDDGLRILSYSEADALDYDSRLGTDTLDILPVDGNWHHFVIQEESAGSITLYIDGVNTLIDTATSFTDLSYILLGCSATVTGYYGGSTPTSNLAFYDRPLTATEITERLYPDAFDGNFLPLPAIKENTVFPVGATVSTSEGTGLLNSSGAPVYALSSYNISQGETKHVVNEDLTAHAIIDYSVSGDITITEGSTISTSYCQLPTLGFKLMSGQLVLADEDGSSYGGSSLFDYNGAVACLEVPNGVTLDNTGMIEYVAVQPFFSGSYFVKSVNLVWGNKETKEQANPQPDQPQFVVAKNDIRSLNKQGIYSDTPLIESMSHSARGYIASTVTLSSIPQANKMVKLFTQEGAMIDEVRTDSFGNYRFDHLLMRKKYMIVAQYGETYDEQPEYAAAAIDWQTPTAY